MYKRETIDRWSKLYWLLQTFFVGPTFRYYYDKFQVFNRTKIPKNRAVILAPNHQNALMDALNFVAGTKRQTVFLMRADVFGGKFLNTVLTFIKTLPIYRIRDGRSTLQKNEEIFELAIQVLNNGNSPLCMFPEGNHGDKRRLRPLVKGIFRIAFKAQEKYKKESGVLIYPVGIDYTHYQKFRKTVFMQFGDPIEVSDYWDDYVENPSVAINKLRERLAEEMKKVMIHIETKDYYDLYMGLRSVYTRRLCKLNGLNYDNLMNRFKMDKQLIASLDHCLNTENKEIETLNSQYKEYVRLRDKLKFRDWVPFKRSYSIIVNFLAIILSVVVLPVALLGLFNNWPNYFIPLVMRKKIKDPQFHSTATWGAGVVIMLVYYLILSVTALFVLPFWWLKLLYIFTLPTSGIFMYNYRRFLIKSLQRIRYSFGMKNKNSEVFLFKKRYDDITKRTGKLVKTFSGRNE